MIVGGVLEGPGCEPNGKWLPPHMCNMDTSLFDPWPLGKTCFAHSERHKAAGKRFSREIRSSNNQILVAFET